MAATLPPESQGPFIDGLEALPLPEHGLDMFASIRVGLSFLVQSEDWDRLAVLPVDHPLVQAETIRKLGAAEGGAVIASFRGKHGHPIVIDRSIVASIVAGDLNGPTMREVLREIVAVDLEVDDPGVVANCNTPESLSEALKENSEFGIRN